MKIKPELFQNPLDHQQNPFLDSLVEAQKTIKVVRVDEGKLRGVASTPRFNVSVPEASSGKIQGGILPGPKE